MLTDIYTRKIVGWQVHDNENSALASNLMVDICRRKNIHRNQLVLDSYNDNSMEGTTILATHQNLGVIPSFSRPLVDNDNQ